MPWVDVLVRGQAHVAVCELVPLSVTDLGVTVQVEFSGTPLRVSDTAPVIGLSLIV